MSLAVTVTGATGFLGNNLVRCLIDQGHQVTVLIRPNSDRKVFESIQPKVIESELGDHQALDVALADADALVHAAGLIWIGKTKLKESLRVNVDLTKTIAQAAKRHQCRMIHVSTVDTLAASTNPEKIHDENDLEPPKSKTSYTVSKRQAESGFLQVVEQGLDGLIVNPSFMLGPWDWKPSSGKMIQAITKLWVPFAPGGGVSAVDVRDVANGIIHSIERGSSGERYILAGHNLTYLDLWKKLAAKAGKSWPKGRLGPLIAFLAGRFGNLKALITRHETELNSEAVNVGQLFSYYSSRKAEQELGYSIGPLEPAIDDAFAWLKQYGYLD